jgi:hypothetical protein
MLGNQLNTVQETLDLLKRVEIMEENKAYRRPNPAPFQHNPPEERRNTNHQNYNRYRDTRNVRNIQQDRYHQRNYDQRNNRGRQAYYQDRRGRNDNPPQQRNETLNHNAPTFRNNRDRVETEVVRRNVPEQGNRD